MTLYAGEFLAAPGGKCTDGHALVDLNVFTDDGSLADYDTGTVIDKEVFADGCTRMDIDSGCGMRIFGHQTRKYGHIKHVEFMCQAIYRDGHDSGVSKNDLRHALGCGISVIECKQIGFQKASYFGNTVKEGLGNLVAFLLLLLFRINLSVFVEIQRKSNLLI